MGTLHTVIVQVEHAVTHLKLTRRPTSLLQPVGKARQGIASSSLEPDFWANINKQGGFPGTVINYIPGINATAGLHGHLVESGKWAAWQHVRFQFQRRHQLGHDAACSSGDVWLAAE